MRLTPSRTLLTSAQFKGQNSECSLFCSACFLFIYLELFWRDRYWQTSQGTTCEAERDRSEEGISQPTKKKKFFYFHFSHAPASWFGLLVLTRRERRKIKEQTNEQHTHTRRHALTEGEREGVQRKKKKMGCEKQVWDWTPTNIQCQHRMASEPLYHETVISSVFPVRIIHLHCCYLCSYES